MINDSPSVRIRAQLIGTQYLHPEARRLFAAFVPIPGKGRQKRQADDNAGEEGMEIP